MSGLARNRTLGLATIVGLSHPLEEVLDVAAAVGLEGVEITGRVPHLRPRASSIEVESVRRAVERRGLEVLAFGSYVGFEGNFGRGDVGDAVAVARDLGAPTIRVWAESPTRQPDERGFDEVVSLLRYCCDEAASHGVNVVVERHANSFADSVSNVERLLSMVGRGNFSLNYQPLDRLPSDAAPTVPDDAARLATHATYLHLKNYRAESSRLELGAPLASGALDYRAVLRAAIDAGYAGPLVLEFTSDDESVSLEARVGADFEFLRQM